MTVYLLTDWNLYDPWNIVVYDSLDAAKSHRTESLDEWEYDDISQEWHADHPTDRGSGLTIRAYTVQTSSDPA